MWLTCGWNSLVQNDDPKTIASLVSQEEVLFAFSYPILIIKGPCLYCVLNWYTLMSIIINWFSTITRYSLLAAIIYLCCIISRMFTLVLESYIFYFINDCSAFISSVLHTVYITKHSNAQTSMNWEHSLNLL